MKVEEIKSKKVVDDFGALPKAYSRHTPTLGWRYAPQRQIAPRVGM